MKNYLKISFFFIVAILTLKNCEKNEDIEIQEERKIEFHSVSKSTAKSVFDSFISKQAKDQEELFNKSKGLTILPDWKSFKQEELNFTDALLTTIDIEINAITSLKPRLIFLNIDGKVLRAIETRNVKETKDNKIENGIIYYHNLDGKFVVGFKIEDGIVTKKLVSRKKTNQANFLSFFTFFSNECDEDLDESSTFCDNELDEVVIRAVNTEASPVYHLSYGGSSGDYSPYGMVVETGGGGSRNGNRNDTNDRRCSGGRVYNYINGTCECPEDYREYFGVCIDEDKIIIELTGKEKCIYEKLKELKLFKETIKKFENSNSYNLKIIYSNCTYTDEACTDGSSVSDGIVTIKVETRVGSYPLSFAATLLHEGIHAEIFKYVDEYKKGTDPDRRENLLSYYFQYKSQNNNTLATSEAQHQHMADKFVKPIAAAIRKLDNYNYPLDYYMGFGWDGLRKYGYDGYYDNGKWVSLTKSESSDYYRKQKTVNNNTKLKNNECK